MKLIIDGREYAIPDSQVTALLADFRKTGEEMYLQQEEWLRFALKPIARWLLDKWEGSFAKKLGKQRAAEICRPPQKPVKKNPVLHAQDVAVLMFGGIASDATLTIQTDGEQTTAFNLSFPAPGEARGQMAPDGNIGQRQNHGAQIPGRDV